MNIMTRILTGIVVGGLVLLAACSEDPPLPDNVVGFESTVLGFNADETELTINFTITRPADADGTITVAFTPSGVTYGTEFTTEPAATSNTIAIPVASGGTTASFKLKKVTGALLDGDETIAFTIQSVSNVFVLGEKKDLALSFAEIKAASGTMEINGGGANYPNKVFIDLSANRQTAVGRATWDLGFSTGSSFRVVLNSSNGMMARVLDKNDLTAVTAADTAGFGAELGISQVFAAINQATPPQWVYGSLAWIDSPTGDLTKTAIAEVSATATENKVYIINRGTGPGGTSSLGWKKIRVIRNGDKYVLQHADISSTTFSSLEISKDATVDFKYASFANGVVTVEPTKERWDIAWSGFTNSTPAGPNLVVPYYFQDVVVTNTNGVQVAKVLTSTVTYEAFAQANVSAVTFVAGSTTQLGIGTDWRSGGGPGTSPAVRGDRFYVIKDADGNVYKLRFTALTTNGERGKPQFEFALVQAGV